jgi:hypothetical protein
MKRLQAETAREPDALLPSFDCFQRDEKENSGPKYEGG